MPPQRISKYPSSAANRMIKRARPNQSIATTPPPQAKQGQGQNGIDIYTYFTKATGDSLILYNGDRNWAIVSLLLETAGPVVVGNRAQITPVLSGKGQLLITNQVWKRTVFKGNRIYIASTSVNRVQVTIEPVPYLEQMLGVMLESK